MGHLLGTLGFRWQIRRLRLLERLRDLITLALVMGSVGAAIGYALVRRGATESDVDG